MGFQVLWRSLGQSAALRSELFHRNIKRDLVIEGLLRILLRRKEM